MFDNVKANLTTKNTPIVRYSLTSANSTQKSDLDYNLYCFSQGYQNMEKGFWRGVLRNKNIDFALRLNKEWNRKIELEDDVSFTDTQSEISSLETDLISHVNEAEIGWDKNLFQNFKKQQAGTKKYKNKEWKFSNGVKRNQVELRTQNYKQFEENERNKKLKKVEKGTDNNLYHKNNIILNDNRYQLSDKTKKYESGENIYSYNRNEQAGIYQYGKQGKGFAAYTSGKKTKNNIYQRNNVSENKYYGAKRQEIAFGQNYNRDRKGNDFHVEAFTLDDRPNNLGRLEVSVERKKKEKIERKPEDRIYVRLCSSKKKKKPILDEKGQPIPNTSRINIDTSKKKEKKERLENRSRLEVSVERKKKEKIIRKSRSRTHERLCSSKKRKGPALDKNGQPIPNTSRININTSKKKEPKERLENRSRLEISVERKKKKVQRKTKSRSHERVFSSKKKRKVILDEYGKPITNTSKKYVNTSKKKEPKERLENRSRLEVSVERKKKKVQRKTKSRSHSRIQSSTKRKLSVDSEGNPLSNTRRLDVDTSKKKEKKERLPNTSRLEVSVEKKKQKAEIKTRPRRHSRISSSPRKRKISYDEEGKPITNVNRLRVGIQYGRVKYAQIEDFDKYEDKNNPRYQTFKKETNIYEYYKPTQSMKTPIKKQEYKKQGIIQNQLPLKKYTEAGTAFFKGKYQYERIKKDDKKVETTNYSDYKTNINHKKPTVQDYSYKNLRYSFNSSISNTFSTNVSDKHNRFEKDISYTNLLDRNYPHKKDLTTKKNYYDIEENEIKTYESNRASNRAKGLSENKKLDFSKYYKKCNTEKKKQQTQYPKPIDNINGYEIYEYNPVPRSDKYIKKSDNRNNKNGLSKDYSKYNIISNKLNKNPTKSELSGETRSSDNKRSSSSAPYNRFSFIKNTTSNFKLQFLTTKQVCEKFWNSINNGEISISIFDPMRKSTTSKLIEIVSPEKLRLSQITLSNDNTNYTNKFRYSTSVNRKMNFSNSEFSFRNSTKL